MQEWWELLSTFEKLFWYIAIPFSVILIIQIILTFIGIDGGHGDVGGSGSDIVTGDPGAPSDPGTVLSDTVDVPQFSIFTFRNFVAFFTVFGWAGIAGIHYEFSTIGVIVFASVCGIGAMLLVSALFYFIGRMAESGNMDIRQAINQTGSVYLPIKANSANVGKIQVTFQDSYHDLKAITRKDDDLPTGTVVKVVGIASGDILIVEKLNE